MNQLGSNITQASAPLLIIELAYPQHRGTLTTMYDTLWYLGSIVAPWTVFRTLNYTSDASWRIPVGVQVVMPFIQYVGIWLLPESPRWLCAKDRGDEALKILQKVNILWFIETLQFSTNKFSTMEMAL